MSVPITPQAIASACCAAADTVSIDVVDATGSTNADLLARIGGNGSARPLHGPTLLVALTQRAGRGRAGRSWQSDAASLTFSLAWPCTRPVAGLLGLPLAVGVAVADVLQKRQIKVALKWPNDILLEGRKLAGILIETATTTEMLHRQTWAVIGIGINLTGAGANQDTNRTVPDSAALADTDRNLLLAELLDALTAALQQFEETGFAPFVGRWNNLHAHAGQRVDILDQGQVLHSGAALGVDVSGRLLLDTGTEVLPILAGDVSLRPSQGVGHAAH